ncbi:hypothetical protein [Chitinophaga vietnamensis]|uniref:hypothetical protein n=1 Tax=Chitinophaga vietnamensis TaxID=2593957 RepID=UPI0011789B1D|nr:hypothetical protein [Chitinophaga vietnamensis]
MKQLLLFLLVTMQLSLHAQSPKTLSTADSSAAAFFSGTKRFIDGEATSYVITIKGSDVEMKFYRKNNTAPRETIRAAIIRNRITLLNGESPGRFLYREGAFAEADNNGTYHTYFECDDKGQLLRPDGKDPFKGVTWGQVLFEKM